MIRTLAILIVMADHLKPTLPLPSEAFRWGWDHFQRVGAEGVYIFFVVSGFLITRIIDLSPGGVEQPSWKHFYVRRVARILPLFLLQVLLGLLFILLFSDGSKKFIYCFKPPDPAGALSFWLSLSTFSFNWVCAALSSTWKGIGNHWHLYWSLAIEEQFYLLYPLILVFLGSRKSIVWFLASVSFLSFAGYWTFPRWFPSIPREVGIYIGAYGQIAVGSLLYLATLKFGSFFSRNPHWSLVTALLGAGILILIFQDGVETYYPCLIAGGTFLFLLGGIHLPALQSKAWKIFAMPGRYSYGNYLLHIMVLYLIHSFLWGLNILVAFLIFAASSTALAALSFRFFEAPTNHFVQRILGVKA